LEWGWAMRILITGNMGYVGSSLVAHLRKSHPDAILHGFDSAFFGHCLTDVTEIPERNLDRQFYGDVRAISPDLLSGYDAVVQLAAISNDPMGHQFEEITYDTNYRATVSIAKAAAAAGVKNFVFASSCSIYGIAEGGARKEGDALNPITAYAKSKIMAEKDLAEIETDMVVSCLRFSTACGMSDRLRLDLVVNDFVAGALATGELSILSDGTPWRPMIDTKDMARAIEWAVSRPADNGGRYLVVNVGSDDRNYQVREIAEAVVAGIPGTTMSINTSAPVDSRSYRVDFSLYRELAPNHQPVVTLADSIDHLRQGLTRMGFRDRNYRQSQLIRLRVLEEHINAGRLSAALEWRVAHAA
jgi:nucleoside-diphosphate-sugar epimerase